MPQSNKLILYLEERDPVGVIETQMKFNASPALNIALVETNLDDLSLVGKLIEKKEADKRNSMHMIGQSPRDSISSSSLGS